MYNMRSGFFRALLAQRNHKNKRLLFPDVVSLSSLVVFNGNLAYRHNTRALMVNTVMQHRRFLSF